MSRSVSSASPAELRLTGSQRHNLRAPLTTSASLHQGLSEFTAYTIRIGIFHIKIYKNNGVVLLKHLQIKLIDIWTSCEKPGAVSFYLFSYFQQQKKKKQQQIQTRRWTTLITFTVKNSASYIQSCGLNLLRVQQNPTCCHIQRVSSMWLNR